MNEMNNLKSKKCSFCKGSLQKGKTEFIAKVEDTIIVVRDVPAFICENCGKAYFSPAMSQKIDNVMDAFHKGEILARPIAAGEVELSRVHTK